MANEIKADYEQLQQIAQRFRAQSQNVQQLTRQVKSRMERLQQSWEGRAADAFFREMNQVLLPGVVRLQKAFDQSSLTVTKIANVMKEAETTAAHLFKGSATGGAGDGGTGYGGGYDEGGSYATSTLNNDVPSYDEQGGDPPDSPTLSPEQVNALGELGITVNDLAGASPDQIQNAIDFLSSDDRISDTILDGGTYTGAELVEAAGILERLEGIGIEFGQSKFNDDTWSLGELRQAENTFESMAQGAAREYVERYGIDGLTALADYYGLPAADAHYAPLAVMMNMHPGNTFEIRRDSQGNVSYYGTDVTLADGSLATRMMYRETQPDGTVGDWVPYNPATQSAPDGAETRNIVWYARYDGNAITFGNNAFDGVDSTNFTDESLFAHELAHRMAPETVFQAFDNTTDDFYGNEGYENVPRSSNTWYEATPDLLTNGLLGTFTDTEAGETRVSDFDDVVDYIFEANRPALEDFAPPTDDYSQSVQDAMQSVGVWSPPSPIPSILPGFTPE